jgi:hypothetical protein
VGDGEGGTAIQLAARRYLQPETAMDSIDLSTANLTDCVKALDTFNANTMELIGILASYGAYGDVGSFPEWYRGTEGLQTPDQILQRKRKEMETTNLPVREKPSNITSGTKQEDQVIAELEAEAEDVD